MRDYYVFERKIAFKDADASTSDGWPPFVLVCNAGQCIKVYVDFSGHRKNCAQLPDHQGYCIYLEDLRKTKI